MASGLSTCWTIIQAAATGSDRDREAFARRYLPVVRAYLAARWRSSPCMGELEDAVQEVFVECFKPGGALAQADSARGFRPFLYGIARHVALRFETGRGRRREEQAASGMDLNQVASSEESLSTIFDRAWARALLREAAQAMQRHADSIGAEALRRVELLRLRFHDGMPIRDIAVRWQVDAAVLHHEYAKARREFKSALLDVVAFHHPGAAVDLERECTDLLALLREAKK